MTLFARFLPEGSFTLSSPVELFSASVKVILTSAGRTGSVALWAGEKVTGESPWAEATGVLIIKIEKVSRAKVNTKRANLVSLKGE